MGSLEPSMYLGVHPIALKIISVMVRLRDTLFTCSGSPWDHLSHLCIWGSIR